jgi:hypothetical protein
MSKIRIYKKEVLLKLKLSKRIQLLKEKVGHREVQMILTMKLINLRSLCLQKSAATENTLRIV